jgi:hypothetical protein
LDVSVGAQTCVAWCPPPPVQKVVNRWGVDADGKDKGIKVASKKLAVDETKEAGDNVVARFHDGGEYVVPCMTYDQLKTTVAGVNTGPFWSKVDDDGYTWQVTKKKDRVNELYCILREVPIEGKDMTKKQQWCQLVVTDYSEDERKIVIDGFKGFVARAVKGEMDKAQAEKET